MKTPAQKKLVKRLVGAVAAAFAASMALTWVLHEKMTRGETIRLIDHVFNDVAIDIRERVDMKMFRQAMVLRDKVYEMRCEPWWSDPGESSRRLRELANELGVDEICIVDSNGDITHSARREEVGALNFRTAEGQAREFAALLDDKFELSQPLLPNTLRGDKVKYVGVWMPEGGFVQVGGGEASVRNLARSALTGLTHGWHVSGDDGGIYITNGSGTIISHPDPGQEGGQWHDPGDDCFWEKRNVEGFPVYVVIPKKTAVAERRVLVATSAFLNGIALVLASFLVGIVIASYVKEQISAQRARELEMAKSIQESAIPRVFPPFPGEKRMDVFASMRTARDVGGDFYDVFFSAKDKIVFMVADVSGKGVPAALFMMRAKAVVKGVAQTGVPLAEVAEKSNDALSLDNDANMFVTAWIGELDLATGVVTYINAGHNPPLHISCGGACSYLNERSGMAFGAMGGMKYKPRTMILRPGELLYLYTDGITEQPDGKGELFGEDRLRYSIETMLSGGCQALDKGSSPLLGALMKAILVHGGEVEQADDCTQMVVRYNGDPSRPPDRPPEREFPPSGEGVAAAGDFLDETIGCGFEALSPKLHIIIDEIASNVAKYSSATSFSLRIDKEEDGRGVKLTFIDDGSPWNPLDHADPDTALPAEKRPVGGLGILMVRKMAANVSYKRECGRNVFDVLVR